MINYMEKESIDCEYFKDKECRNKQISNGWFYSMFPRKCIEYKLSYAKCTLKENLFDMVKRQTANGTRQRVQSARPVSPPPGPGNPIHIHRDGKPITITEGKWKR